MGAHRQIRRLVSFLCDCARLAVVLTFVVAGKSMRLDHWLVSSSLRPSIRECRVRGTKEAGLSRNVIIHTVLKTEQTSWAPITDHCC
jgi:hypothetical protein